MGSNRHSVYQNDILITLFTSAIKSDSSDIKNADYLAQTMQKQMYYHSCPAKKQQQQTSVLLKR